MMVFEEVSSLTGGAIYNAGKSNESKSTSIEAVL